MLDRVAEILTKVISPISRVLADIGVVMVVLVILVVVSDVTLRRFFSAPISGSRDLTILGFSIIVFLPMALCTMTDSQIQVDFLVSKFPKSVRRGLEVVMIFITTIILGLMSWEISKHPSS